MALLYCDHSTHFHLFSAWVLLGFLPITHWKLSPRLSIIWLEDVVCVWVTQLCPTLCDPMNWGPPGSSVHGILQAWILEWVASSLSRDLLDPGIKPRSPALQANLNIKSQGILWIISPSWSGGHNRYSFESFLSSFSHYCLLVSRSSLLCLSLSFFFFCLFFITRILYISLF